MKLLITLPAVLLGTLYLGHQANNMELPTNDRYEQYFEILEETPIEAPDPAPSPTMIPTPSQAPTPPTPIDISEDGSAKMSDGTTRPEDTYPWDCRTEGNMICGAEVNGTWYLLDFDTMTFSLR